MQFLDYSHPQNNVVIKIVPKNDMAKHIVPSQNNCEQTVALTVNSATHTDPAVWLTAGGGLSEHQTFCKFDYGTV